MAEQFLRVIEASYNPVPAQPGVPFWDRDWIDPDLHQRLFGPIDNTVPNTYLIVDATLRTQLTKIFDLDDLDVPCECLFKGAAAEDFAQSAPYLIDLTLPSQTIPDFHKKFFTDHWDKGTGIIIRSHASLREVWSHFRKFNKIKDTSGRSVFFRYWETNAARDYFGAVANLPNRAKDFFHLKSGQWIDLIVSHSEAVDETYEIAPNYGLLSTAGYSKPPYILSQAEEAALYTSVLRRHAKAIETEIIRERGAARMTQTLVLDCIRRMQPYGFLRLEYLKALAIRDMAAGGPFEQNDPSNLSLNILRSPLPEDEKFANLEQHWKSPFRA